jgi:quercetin dioxygenase-like cupin family protein
MPVIYQNETSRTTISPGRERYLTYTNKLMMVVIDFTDGPGAEPDPPHNHPHEQITYVAEGAVNFFINDVVHKLGVGDMITVPPDAMHTIQLLTDKVRLVDTFCPIREDFLE